MKSALCAAFLTLVNCFAVDHLFLILNDKPLPLKTNETLWIGESHSPIKPARLRSNGKFSSIFPVLQVSTQKQPVEVSSTNTVPITLDQLAYGAVPEGATLRFELTLTKPSTYEIEVIASRLGSQLDPVVRILNGQGREIAFSDDSLQGGRDSLASFKTATKNTKVFVELHDVANGGGPNYFYCLNPKSDDSGLIPSNADWPQWNDKLPEIADELPIQGRGMFDQKLRLNCKAGQRIIVSVDTRKFGSPHDALLKFVNPASKVVAESVGAGPDGPSITNKIDKAGEYQIEIRELTKSSGPFWLRVEEAKPGVVLTTEVERIDFSKDGEAKLKIACKRYDYDGPVKLEADGLPEGVSLVDAVIPKGKNETEVKFKRDQGVEAFQVRIHGLIEGDSFPVSTMPALRKLYPLQMFPSAAMDGWIAVNPAP